MTDEILKTTPLNAARRLDAASIGRAMAVADYLNARPALAGR